MHETTVTAVVLRRSDVGESDRRLVLFTRELGKIEAIAKGARKGGSRLAGVSEPLMVAKFHLASGRVRRFVTQAQPISSLPALRTDYRRLTCGLALAELVSVQLPYEAVQPEVFDTMALALSAMGGASDPAAPLAWFAARLLAAEGQMPDWSVCAVTGRAIGASLVWYSPAARGAVLESEAERFADRRRTSREALGQLQRLSDLDRPPECVTAPVECCSVLLRFWQGALDAPLPAWEAAVQALEGIGE